MARPDTRAWMLNSEIRTAAESLRSGLQLARTEAVRRNTVVAFSLAGTVWTVAAGASTVQTNSGERVGLTQIAATQDVLSFDGVGWVAPLPAVDISFNVSNPSGGACAASGGSVRCLRVTVSGGGQIRLCDPAAPAGQATAC